MSHRLALSGRFAGIVALQAGLGGVIAGGTDDFLTCVRLLTMMMMRFFWIHMLFGDDDENLHEFIGFFLKMTLGLSDEMPMIDGYR